MGTLSFRNVTFRKKLLDPFVTFLHAPKKHDNILGEGYLSLTYSHGTQSQLEASMVTADVHVSPART